MPNTTISPVSPHADVDTQLQVGVTRTRRTERPAQPFHDVLAGGVSLLLSGAEVATHVVAGPVMAAAVHDARVGATGALSGTAGSTSSGDLQSILQDGQSSNLQLLALQQQIQAESQQFSTVSNVMRARYDTAKAAVSNIRA
jgi:hypothetical protein